MDMRGPGGYESDERYDEWSSHGSGRSPLRVSPPASRRSASVQRRLRNEQLNLRQIQQRHPPRVPRMRPEQLPQVDTLTTELLGVQLSSSSRFQPLTEDRIRESSAILVRYGIPTVEAFKQAEKQARSYLSEDLRQREQRNFPELSFLITPSQHLTPHIQGGSAKVTYAELDIPSALKTYAPSLQFLEACFRPTQSMVNFVRKELEEAPGKDPPFNPFLNPKLSASPWMPDSADHVTAHTSWIAYSETRQKKLRTDLSIRSFLLYRLRFVFATDLCAWWLPFDGLSSQLNHVSIALNLSIVETVGIDPQYRTSLFAKLSEKARQRTDAPEEFKRMPCNDQPELRDQARRDLAAQAVKPKADPPVKAPAPKKVPKAKPSPKKQPRRSERRKRSRSRKRSPPKPRGNKRQQYRRRN